MGYEAKLDSSLDVLRRLDPKFISQNLNDICSVLQNDRSGENEELTQELLSIIDVPLDCRKCSDTGKEYLCCDYNRDGDSYRSPWSNKYWPAIEDEEEEEAAPFPSKALRQLEIKANESFGVYRDLYYENSGISSVYLWDTGDEETDETLAQGFAGVVLLKKETDDKSGKWDAVHVFEVVPETLASATYKLTSTVILDLQSSSLSSLSLSGNITRQLESTQSLSLENALNVETAHLINIGKLVEKSEYNLRNLLQEVYFDKLKDIMIKDLRSIGDVSGKSQEEKKQQELVKGLQGL